MTQRNRFIDIAKGMAIILVLFNHYEWQENSLLNTHLYYWMITMAVPVFMLCTGYVTASSFDKKNISFDEARSKKQIIPKLVRYTMPFLWFYIAETILTAVAVKTGLLQHISTLDFPYNAGYADKKMTLLGSIIFFFAGGRGQHGTYYFPVIIQVVFLMPYIYNAVKKSKNGIWKCFAVTVGLDVLVALVGNIINVNVSAGYNRMIAFRYVFALAMGCYVYLYRENLGKIKWFVMFALGVGYTCLVTYVPSYKPFVYSSWQYTSAMSMLYISPLFVLGIRYLENIKFKPLEEIGKASYHILMVQILYYNFAAPFVWTAPKNIIPNDAVGFIVGLVICLGGGYGYYRLYGFLARKYNDKRHG
ncbi:MAG: acyltransferase [Ruminococcaceae bacterium]|nr:acyltransferase [Oscillospiraceae bacterium]